MKRIHKIRAWGGNGFMYPSQAFLNNGELFEVNCRSWSCGIYDQDVIDLATGVIDSNGIEIYENDIVMGCFGFNKINIVSKVEYDNGSYIVNTKKLNSKTQLLSDFVKFANGVIVGNFYQNIELLQE